MKIIIIWEIICLGFISFLNSGTGTAFQRIHSLSEYVFMKINEYYDLEKIGENVISAMGKAAREPGRIIEKIKSLGNENRFIPPVNEGKVSSISCTAESSEYICLSDKSIVIYASESGMVDTISDTENGGIEVTIKHDGGVSTRYLGCTRLYVKERERGGNISCGAVI